MNACRDVQSLRNGAGRSRNGIERRLSELIVASCSRMHIVPEDVLIRINGIPLGGSADVSETVEGAIAKEFERRFPDVEAINVRHQSLAGQIHYKLIEICIKRL